MKYICNSTITLGKDPDKIETEEQLYKIVKSLCYDEHVTEVQYKTTVRAFKFFKKVIKFSCSSYSWSEGIIKTYAMYINKKLLLSAIVQKGK